MSFEFKSLGLISDAIDSSSLTDSGSHKENTFAQIEGGCAQSASSEGEKSTGRSEKKS